MKRDISFISYVAVLTALTGIANAIPPTPVAAKNSFSIPQFYAGLSGGFENFTGHRSEKLISTAPLASESHTFSDNKKFFSRADIALSAIAGFLWRIPNLPLSIGPEIYLGQGTGKDTVKSTYSDNLAGEGRTYTADFKRKLFYGILVRTGWNFWQDYFGYLSLGLDFSQFRTDREMITRTNFNPPNVNTLRQTKKLTGFVAGIGVEKRFGSFCVGMDFKRIAYKQQNFFDILKPDPGISPNQLAFSAKPRIYSLSLRFSYFF